LISIVSGVMPSPGAKNCTDPLGRLNVTATAKSRARWMPARTSMSPTLR
jgi:hypothetical protein